MNKFIKVLIGAVAISFIGVFSKALITANKIDKEAKLEKNLALEKDQIISFSSEIGNDLKEIISNENLSLGEKINNLEEYEDIYISKLNSSSLSKEIKQVFIEITPDLMELFKTMGYANIYIYEGLSTLDLSYIDLAEKKFDKLKNEKIKEQTKEYCDGLRKVIKGLQEGNLDPKIYNKVVEDEKKIRSSFFELSNGILN